MSSPTRLFQTLAEKTKFETRNALLQFDEVLRQIDESNGVLNLTSATICNLQRIAIQDIYSCAGNFRQGPIWIHNSTHKPPLAEEVPGHVADMCQHVNGNNVQTPLYAAAYVLWRLNWIHPFMGGNGRTARAVSYLVLSVKLGFRLPGAATIPVQIMANRIPYYEALDEADAAWKRGLVDVSRMELLLGQMLHRQLGIMVPRSSKPLP